MGRIWRQLFEHRRQILRGCTECDTHTYAYTYTNCNSNSNCHSYAYLDTFIDSETYTGSTAAPNSPTAPVVFL